MRTFQQLSYTSLSYLKTGRANLFTVHINMFMDMNLTVEIKSVSDARYLLSIELFAKNLELHR